LRGYQKEGVVQAIRDAGGEMFGITSEPQTLASEAAESWGLDFALVGDPHHEIADQCRERGWLDLIVHTVGDASGKFTRGHDAMVHPKGYFQPGVLALTPERRVLYRWRGVPTRKNNGGATERPTAAHVWQKISEGLAAPTSTDAALDTPPAVDMKGIPWPIFVLLLLANGNFWHPKGFGLKRGGSDDSGRHAKRALGKLALFVAGWIAAFAWLPAGWVAAALLAWGVIVMPGIVALHRTFQNVEQYVEAPDPSEKR
jgi:peroxiredoxin